MSSNSKAINIKTAEKLLLPATKKDKAHARQLLRNICGVHSSVSVIVYNELPVPRMTLTPCDIGGITFYYYGFRGGWRTKSGKTIRHPGAYAKKGFSNMHYRLDSRKLLILQSNWDALVHYSRMQ